ncbi:hypothetical protein [Methanolobus sp. WCC4]|uniref:hypothetical protein n=1 Tax=Methanolobus sp. WCC4 TaxID=3125784 RepID=UPI0030F58E34
MKLNLKRATLIISLSFIVSLIIIGSGCLETPEATPATIDENALTAYGWSQVGIEEKSFEQELTDSKSLTISSVTVEYYNDRLMNDINEQALSFAEENNIPFETGMPASMTAHMVTYRLTLPSGAKLPTDLMSDITERMVNDMKEGNGIEDIEDTKTRTIILNDGTEASVRIFTGSGNSTDTDLRMIGFVTAFEGENTNTFVMGFTPDGEHRIEAGIVDGTLFSVDGESELDEMLELVSTIE